MSDLGTSQEAVGGAETSMGEVSTPTISVEAVEAAREAMRDRDRRSEGAPVLETPETKVAPPPVEVPEADPRPLETPESGVEPPPVGVQSGQTNAHAPVWERREPNSGW